MKEGRYREEFLTKNIKKEKDTKKRGNHLTNLVVSNRILNKR